MLKLIQVQSLYLGLQPTPLHLIASLTITGRLFLQGLLMCQISLSIQTHTIALLKIIMPKKKEVHFLLRNLATRIHKTVYFTTTRQSLEEPYIQLIWDSIETLLTTPFKIIKLHRKVELFICIKMAYMKNQQILHLLKIALLNLVELYIQRLDRFMVNLQTAYF